MTTRVPLWFYRERVYQMILINYLLALLSVLLFLFEFAYEECLNLSQPIFINRVPSFDLLT